MGVLREGNGLPTYVPGEVLALGGPWAVALVPWEIRPPTPSLTIVVRAVAVRSEQGWRLCDAPEPLTALLLETSEAAAAIHERAPFKPECDVVVRAERALVPAPHDVALRFGHPGRQVEVVGDPRTPSPHGLGARRCGPELGEGRYDRVWRATRWPFFPADFDWGCFQCAPPKQRLPFARGDEPFALLGFLPDAQLWHGQLPGVVPRVLCRDRRGIEELGAHLDTIVLDVDRDEVALTWRAICERPLGAMRDIDRLAIVAQNLADPWPAPDALFERLGSVPEPPAPPEDDAAFRITGEVGTGSEPLSAAVAAGSETTTEGTARSDGTVVAEAGQAPPDESDDDAALVERLHAIARAAAPALAPGFAAQIAEASSAPLSPPASVAPPSIESLRRSGLATEQAAELLRLLRDEPDEPAADEPLDDGQGDDGDDEAAASGRGHEPEPRPGGDHAGVDWRGRKLRGVDLRGANLKGAQLDGADLSGADLSGADLSGASLDDACLMGAKLGGTRFEGSALGGANLSSADARAACFDGASAQRCSFREAKLDGASLVGAELGRAELSECSLDRANLSRAKLERASLFGAAGQGVRFDEARLDRVMADGASLPEARFDEASLERSCWRGAQLPRASFRRASLRAAVLTHVNCPGALLPRADLREARLDDADFSTASFAGANLMASSLGGARLEQADLRGANLYRAGLWRACLTGAQLEGAIVAATALEGP